MSGISYVHLLYRLWFPLDTTWTNHMQHCNKQLFDMFMITFANLISTPRVSWCPRSQVNDWTLRWGQPTANNNISSHVKVAFNVGEHSHRVKFVSRGHSL